MSGYLLALYFLGWVVTTFVVIWMMIGSLVEQKRYADLSAGLAVISVAAMLLSSVWPAYLIVRVIRKLRQDAIEVPEHEEM